MPRKNAACSLGLMTQRRGQGEPGNIDGRAGFHVIFESYPEILPRGTDIHSKILHGTGGDDLGARHPRPKRWILLSCGDER
ncbi:MAG: hypothetical protein ACTSUE_15405 [Promethearchaeota archaeon]